LTETPEGHLAEPGALAARVNGAAGVAASAEWLVSHADLIADFSSAEEWAVETDGGGPVEHHLIRVRAELARQLWQRRLFVSVPVLDELLFDAVRRRLPDPVLEVVIRLASSQLTRPTYVIYPLHSFGLLGTGLLLDPDQVSSEHLAREFGLAISAQHRNVSDAANWLEQVHHWFGVDGRVPVELLRHWRRSRAPWLESNPLLVIRVHNLSGYYYENQRLLLDRLHVATAFLGGLAIRQPEPTGGGMRLFSTRRVNSWQTLDIHHYFVMDAGIDGDGEIGGGAVPMNRQASYLAELSDLPVDLDLAYWNERTDAARGLWQALDTVADLQLPTRFRRAGGGRPPASARMARKIFRSLDYFRRSLGADDRWYAVTSLATALEMLLTSHYAAGVSERLRRRTELLLGDSTAASAVFDVYRARSELVHAGDAPSESLPLATAQRAYLDCLERVAAELPNVAATDADPLRSITSDIAPSQFP
jgi:hypothetical protein